MKEVSIEARSPPLSNLTAPQMTIFSIAITMDIVCAAISMAGSLLVARYDRWSYLGWMAWLVANILWIVWAFTAPKAPVWGVVAQNVFFFYTSVKGYLTCRKSMKEAAAPGTAPAGLTAPT